MEAVLNAFGTGGYLCGEPSPFPMQEVFFSIARFLEATFDWLLVPFGWLPIVAFSLILGFGALYWLMLQARYTRRARERKEYI